MVRPVVSVPSARRLLAAVTLVAGATASLTYPAAGATTELPAVVLAHARTAAAYGASHHMTTGIAVVDTRTGAIATAGHPQSEYVSASVVKVLIATRLLLKGRMHGHIAHEARIMIASSDNTAADELYPQVGGDALEPWLARHYAIAGLGRPATGGLWGLTRLTPVGLARLYTALRNDPKVWPWLSRAMHAHTARSTAGEPDDWGLAAASETVAMKNGWLLCRCPGGHDRSVINTTGFVGHDRYAVVILTAGRPSQYYTAGERIVSHLARMVVLGGRLLD